MGLPISNAKSQFKIESPGHYEFVLHVYASDSVVDREATDSLEFDVIAPSTPVDKF